MPSQIPTQSHLQHTSETVHNHLSLLPVDMALHRLTNEEDAFDIALDAIIFGAVKREINKVLEERLDSSAKKVVHKAVKGGVRVEKSGDVRNSDAGDQSQPTSEGKQALEEVATDSGTVGVRCPEKRRRSESQSKLATIPVITTMKLR